MLELISRLHSSLLVCFILFGLCAGCGINVLKLGNRKRRFLGIFPLIIVLKIHKFRFAHFQLCDNQPHLQSPISQVHVADHRVTHKPANPLDALPDNGRTQMPYMQRLCHIRSAVINHNFLRFFTLSTAKASRICAHLPEICRKIFMIQPEI